jgi:transcriptional regulator with XRE-family HTH domain
MDLCMELGGSLRRIRVERGLTQAEVAGRAAISRLAYRNIETGRSSPRITTLLAIARALGVSAAALLPA